MSILSFRTPRQAVVLRANECWNPSLEIDGGGWSWTGFGPGGSGADVRGTGYSFIGPGSIYKVWSVPPTGSQEDAGFQYLHGGWTAGMTKTASASMWCSNISVDVACKLRYYDAGGNFLGYDVGNTEFVSAGTAWTRVSATGTAPAGTARVAIWFVLMPTGNKPGVNTVLSLDACLIEPGSGVGDFFSGDTWPTGYGEFSTAWEGAQSASRSLMYELDPDGKTVPDMVLGYESSQQSRNVVHQLIDGGVSSSLLVASTRQGTLKLLYRSAAAAESARSGHAAAGTWQFSDSEQPQENMTYVVDGAVRKYQTDSRAAWILEIPFRELR